MLTSSTFLALAASPAMGAYVGFNYGATFTNGAVKVQSDYEAEFKAAQALVSAPETFSSARIYTMIVRTIVFYVLCVVLTMSHLGRLTNTHSSKAALPTLSTRPFLRPLAPKPHCY